MQTRLGQIAGQIKDFLSLYSIGRLLVVLGHIYDTIHFAFGTFQIIFSQIKIQFF